MIHKVLRDEEETISQIIKSKHLFISSTPIIYHIGYKNIEDSEISHDFQPDSILKPNKQNPKFNQWKPDIFSFITLITFLLIFVLLEKTFVAIKSQSTSTNSYCRSNRSIGSLIFDFILKLRDLR